MKFFPLFTLLLFSQPSFAQAPPEIMFRIPEKDLIPEGITHDPITKDFFVGSIQKRKIVRISGDGKVSDFMPSLNSGLYSVLGLNVKDQKLWACNNSPEYDTSVFISCVHIFDIASGRLWKKYTLNDGKKHLFNDVVITREGVGYVSDSNGGGVYRIMTNRDTVESFIAGGTLRYPNGIALSSDEKKLFVSTSSGIMSVDIETKSVSPLPHDKFVLIGIDGLYRYGNSLIAIQNVTFPESILEYRCNSDFTSIASVIPKALNHPGFDTPTTGVIVGNQFYFIANSQLLQVVGAGGRIKNPEALKETLIMKIRLD